MAADEGNGRVTNREIYDLLTDLRKEFKADIKCVDDRIDILVEKRSELSQRVIENKTRLDYIDKKVNILGAGDSLGVIVAGILAYFGIRT